MYHPTPCTPSNFEGTSGCANRKYIGCQTVLCILLHGIVSIFSSLLTPLLFSSHTLRTFEYAMRLEWAARLAGVCRVSESLTYSTA